MLRPELAALLRTGTPAELVAEIERWLDGGKMASREPLLAWIPMEAWPGLIERARASSGDRADDVLEEAARQVPELVGASTPRVPTRHLAFEEGYAEWSTPHPTQVTPGADRVRFGGATAVPCGYCHEPLHRLLELGGLELATCLSCLGWEQPNGDYALSYQHDEAGIAHPLDRLEAKLTPQFPNKPFVETSIALVDLGPRWWSQEWGKGNLHRAGGEPVWIQNDEIRDCRACKTPMAVVLQLDSELPQADGRRFAFGSGGILYVQVCQACRTSTHLWQCT